MNPVPQHALILFDGVCNLCNGFVQFVIRHDKRGIFRFASLQSETARNLLQPLAFQTEPMNTIVLIENGKIYTRSKAVIRIAKQLDGFYKAAILLYIFPSFLSDAVYNFISRNRYRIFGKRSSCMVPSPDLKSRFLE
jgi:predicted DCC family thiol-disulfide oxidoreductase YuxK